MKGELNKRSIAANKLFTQKQLEAVKEVIAHEEQRLALDITDQEAIDFVKDKAKAHGSIRAYYNYMHEADIS